VQVGSATGCLDKTWVRQQTQADWTLNRPNCARPNPLAAGELALGSPKSPANRLLAGLRQLTHNNVDDIVMDWQSLHDLRAPTVKALTSHGRPGKRITLRFRASDNSGRASVAITVFVGKRPYGYVRTPLKHRSAGHTYTAIRASPNVKGLLRFCAEACDPSGNESSRSCARIVTK
jgi:hypothetical protein